jgi:hypothetical protein
MVVVRDVKREDDVIRFRRGLAIEWYNVNPILGEGEPGYEIDTHRIKIGDGVSRWTTLDYFMQDAAPPEVAVLIEEHVLDPTPHPAYDEGPSLSLLYENKKV